MNVTFSISQDDRVAIQKSYFYYTRPRLATQYLILDESEFIGTSGINRSYAVQLPVTENDHGLGVIFICDVKIIGGSSQLLKIFAPENYLDFFRVFEGM